MQNERINLRYNILSTLVYIIGIIILIQLFNLQIVHGEEYRTKSNTRLTRETTVQAARGNIYDRTGNVLAGTKTGFTLEIYRSKIDIQTLNNTILKLLNILEKNGDIYTDNFPITIEPFAFKYTSQENIDKWKEENKIELNATPEEIIYKYKEKYEIQNEDIKEIRKIIAIRYEIAKTGYSSTMPLVISKNISLESYNQIKEQSDDFPGMNMYEEALRTYKGSLASHILGYVGKIDNEEIKTRPDYGINDYIGKIGIEYVFEKYLRGEKGTKQVDMAIDGSITGEYITKEAVAGSDVVLTIDANLQTVAENALKANIEKIKNGGFAEQYNAQAGAVVVTNVKTGEILAMASYPDYEPELFVNGISNEKWYEYTQKGESALLNRTIQGTYAPGSIFKMVSAIAGLETGAITRNEIIVDKGIYQYSRDYKPRCWIYNDYGSTHGAINVSGAIKHSCNYYFYEVAKRMGIENLEKYAKYFGLGEKTGIELLDERAGTVAGKTDFSKRGETWYDGIALSAVIGQSSNSFTPLQMAKYISMLTNGGKNIDITLIKDIIRADGTKVGREEINSYLEEIGIKKPEIEQLDINKENLKAVLDGMKSVTTESGGTAYSVFKNSTIEVGGKTGSAEAGRKVNAWFAGFAPFDDPEIAVVVLVENGGHGSYTAEVVREIIEQYFGMNSNKVTEDVTAMQYIN